MAIYTDASGYPGTKVASGYNTTSDSGWDYVNVSASLSPNTDYWLVFGDDDGGTLIDINPARRTSLSLNLIILPGRSPQLSQLVNEICPRIFHLRDLYPHGQPDADSLSLAQ